MAEVWIEISVTGFRIFSMFVVRGAWPVIREGGAAEAALIFCGDFAPTEETGIIPQFESPWAAHCSWLMIGDF